MDSARFKHLQHLIGYDNEQMARMLRVDPDVVTDFRSGVRTLPDGLAAELELFVDWASEVGDTAVKKDLARKHLKSDG
ncbi:MAG: hypothetical protein R2940_08445 [Syntrophotaleaceae bacterium]